MLNETHKTVRWRRRWMVLPALLMGAVAVVFLRERGPSESERWIAEHRRLGERFTLAEFEAERSTAHNPRFMEIVETTDGRLSQLTSRQGPQSSAPAPAPGRARVRWRQPMLESVQGSLVPWAPFQSDLDRLETGVFAPLRAALENPPEDPGWARTNYLGIRLNYVAIRQVAQGLADAAMAEMQRGQHGRALANGIAGLRLARAHRTGHQLVHQMIRVALTGLAVDTTWDLLQREGWTDAELAQLQGELEQIQILPDLLLYLQVERAALLDLLDRLRAEGMEAGAVLFPTRSGRVAPSLRDRIAFGLWRAAWSERDRARFLRQFQIPIDAARGVAEGRPWLELRRASLQAWEASKPTGLLEQRFWFSSISLPNFQRALQSAVETDTRRRMAIVAVALERYRVQRGEYPQALEALTPEFLVALPEDPFTGEDFGYQLENGSPRIYSAGPNSPDDVGDRQPPGAQGRDRETAPEGGSRFLWPLPATNAE